MKDIKVIFMGTPIFASIILDELIKKYNVIMVVCQPDREKDRKGNIIYSPCKKLAIENNIQVFQPLKIRDEYQKILDMKKLMMFSMNKHYILLNPSRES